ncbi:hypothetical protein BH09PSE2_BH09PSE2_06430 [soil metagenome]
MNRTALALLAALMMGGSAASARPPARNAVVTKGKAARTAEAQRFSRWIEDLPLMPGLYETDAGYSFEVAKGGRLAEARLHGVVAPQVVKSFYASTLPALGWSPQGGAAYAYERGRERLILHVSPAKPQGVMAVFVLTPNPSPAATPDADAPAPHPSQFRKPL